MSDVHPSTIENLIACRDQLMFTLADQHPPSDEIAKPLWDAYVFLHGKIEELQRETGYVGSRPRTDWTAFGPRDDNDGSGFSS